uniref:Uncharacterized protein n=1 Tax=Timema shepardi TaxID=629360 RepID=A0A7R9B2D1_TIMSH|nr:unnamed protein product [Timema shepardi]
MSLLLMMFITWVLASGSLAHPLPDDEDAVDVNENLLEAHFSELNEVIFGLPKKETGEKVSQWHPQMEVNPEELGEYLEGDILFPETLTRNGLKAESSRWPKGIVYYTLSSYFLQTELYGGVVNRAHGINKLSHKIVRWLSMAVDRPHNLIELSYRIVRSLPD